jgi:hypothetical protein
MRKFLPCDACLANAGGGKLCVACESNKKLIEDLQGEVETLTPDAEAHKNFLDGFSAGASGWTISQYQVAQIGFRDGWCLGSLFARKPTMQPLFGYPVPPVGGFGPIGGV